jgi:hypothetical protein
MLWLDSVAAVLEAWYPGGEDGIAGADVLIGEVNPSGKLPMTFPASDGPTFARNPEWYPGNGQKVQYDEKFEVGYRWYQSQHLTIRKEPRSPIDIRWVLSAERANVEHNHSECPWNHVQGNFWF